MTDNDRIILHQIAKNQIAIMSALGSICTDDGTLDAIGALLAEAERALEHCLREHGGFTIKGETESVIRATLAKLKAARP